MSQPQMKLSLANFEFQDLPNLLIIIWEYNDETNKNCSVCKQYDEWCIKVGKRSGKTTIWILILLLRI